MTPSISLYSLCFTVFNMSLSIIKMDLTSIDGLLAMCNLMRFQVSTQNAIFSICCFCFSFVFIKKRLLRDTKKEIIECIDHEKKGGVPFLLPTSCYVQSLKYVFFHISYWMFRWVVSFSMSLYLSATWTRCLVCTCGSSLVPISKDIKDIVISFDYQSRSHLIWDLLINVELWMLPLLPCLYHLPAYSFWRPRHL